MTAINRFYKIIQPNMAQILLDIEAMCKAGCSNHELQRKWGIKREDVLLLQAGCIDSSGWSKLDSVKTVKERLKKRKQRLEESEWVVSIGKLLSSK